MSRSHAVDDEMMKSRVFRCLTLTARQKMNASNAVSNAYVLRTTFSQGPISFF